MSSELTALSLERTAQLVPPQARGELLSVLREAAALLPVAEAVVAACDVPGIRATEPAKSAGLVASAFIRMAGRVRSLPVKEPLRSRIARLLDFHAELIGQASLMAYRERTERQERARGSGGLGSPAIELAGLADQLARALDSTSRTPPSSEAG
jgi:hypothetical protein